MSEPVTIRVLGLTDPIPDPDLRAWKMTGCKASGPRGLPVPAPEAEAEAEAEIG